MIDCDVHCQPSSLGDLAPYLSRSWLDYTSALGIGLEGWGATVSAYPEDAPTSATLESRREGRAATPSSWDDVCDGLPHSDAVTRFVVNCVTTFGLYRNPYWQGAIASAVNDWLLEEFIGRDSRVSASLVVPWADPCGAVAEIERMGGHDGFVQVLLPARADVLWGNRANHKLLGAAADHGLAIALHAWGPSRVAMGGGCISYIEDYLAQAALVQRHIVSLIAEGAFELFPRLRVMVLECGFAWLPSLLWRMDKDWTGIWPEIPWVKEKPSTYVRRSMRFSIAPGHLGNATTDEIRELVEVVGSDLLVYGSDYPHYHGQCQERILSAVDDAASEAILAENAARFYAQASEVAA